MLRRIMLGMMFVFVMTTALAQEETPEPPHWTYEEEETWAELDPSFASCSTGHAQSPIDITGALSVNLSDLSMNYQPSALNIFNNGHTIQVNYDAGSKLVYNEIEYSLIQFHFHHPAEHTIEAQTFPMELHFVHKSAEGALAVVGVMLQEGETDNPAFAAIFDNLPAEAGEPQPTELTVNAAGLLPEAGLYTTYTGSLTTPPCTQGVRWLVLQTPVEVSTAQIDAFAAIFEMNARSVQPLNARDLLSDSQ